MKVKQKTKKAAAKRFTETKSGELKRKHAYRSHMAVGSTTKAKRHLKKDGLVHKSDRKRYEQCL
jgi:large subunit ribosomal protein L35